MCNAKNRDLTVIWQGSVVAFYPHTELAKGWIADNVESESWQWLGGGLIVDRRFAGDLIQGMLGSGITIN